MKLQCGVLFFDGRLATLDDLANLVACSKTAEIAGEAIDGPLAMVYRGDRITAEEEFETQPCRAGDYRVTWDGRLDNREEMAKLAGLNDIATVPDPLIVLRAYEARGPDVLSRLIGEFALTLWCCRTQSLEFARSTCGARTLYYVLKKDGLLWSTNFAHLVRMSGVDLTVNDEYVLEYLVCQPSASSSPLANLQAVPPNRLIRFERGRMVSKHELWNPTGIFTFDNRKDQEYEQELRHKIDEAVRVRLRAKTPVFSELSGGLDSSAIVTTADHLTRNRPELGQEVRTLSFVYDTSTTADERAFISAIENQRGVKSLLICEQEQQITLGLTNPVFSGVPNPLHCFPGRYRRVGELMRDYNSRVLLTGGGGDHLFWSEANGSTLVADRLCKGDIHGAHTQCKIWGQSAAVRYADLLQSALPWVFHSVFPCKPWRRWISRPNWIHPRHNDQVLAVDPSFEQFSVSHALPTKKFQIVAFEHMFRHMGAGFFQEFDDVYVSHPYTHRPLLEFCLRTPVSQFLRNGETRSLMRRALSDRLPAKVLRRVSKGLLDETLFRALQNEWDTIGDLQSWMVSVCGYISIPHALDSLTKARLGLSSLTGPLIRLFSVERWLRSLSRVTQTHNRA
jgi:asparagine synthase (glutamine-hydrolysing)